MEAKMLTASRFVDQKTGISYRYVYSETEYFRPHYHDYFEIFLVLSGNARHLVNGTECPLQPGDLIFIRPSDIHDYISNGSGYSMLNITFTKETLNGLFAFLGEGFPANALMQAPQPPNVVLNSDAIQSINARMTAIRAIDQDDVSAQKTALRILIFEIFSKHFSAYITESHPAPDWLLDVCEQMQHRGSYVEGSEAMFALAGRTREHVCRSMKKYMGITVSDFINELRLRYIASMLRSSNHTISQIVFSSGFNNLSWASELFKKKYGVSMRDYRRNLL